MSYKENLSFQYHIPTRIIFGAGSANSVRGNLKMLGVERAIIVTDKTIANMPEFTKIKERLGERLASVFDGVVPDSGFDVVNEAIKLARETGAKGVVSIGGGSCMDTGKCVALLLAKDAHDIREFVGLFKAGAPTAPHITLPTTAGTGSEVTSMAVIKDTDKNVKAILIDPHLIPTMAILDPELTKGMPPIVTASTGMDALTHAIEAIHSINYNPLSDAMALWAIETIFKYLPRCVTNGDDLEARGMMLLSANSAGCAFQNALVGIVHAIAHSLGGVCKVPHGIANGIMLPYGMRYNISKSAHRYALVAKAMGLNVRDISVERSAQLAIEEVAKLVEKLGLPSRLRDASVPENALEDVAKLSMTDMSLFTNPVQPKGWEEILEMLKRAW